VITAPLDGTTVSGDTVMVTGRLAAPINTGVVAGQTHADIVGNPYDAQFYSNVRLVPGENIVLVTATTPDGQELTDTVTVIRDGSPPADIRIETDSAVAPAMISIEIDNTVAAEIERIDVDFDSDGTIDFSSYDPDVNIEYPFTEPGIYPVTIIVIYTDGTNYTETRHVVIHDVLDREHFFQANWNAMNRHLLNGDVEAAVTHITAKSKPKYGAVFEALLPHMEEIVTSYSILQRLTITDSMAEFAVNRYIDNTNRIFLIYFLRDVDGIWRLAAM